MKDAIDTLASVGEWEKAKRIVNELAPDIEPYLEEKYKEAMLRDGRIDRLVEIDANAGLEVLAGKGQWNQVFETASAQGTQTLHKYVAQRAVQLLKGNSPLEALQLYAKYGAPAMQQNFNLYLQLSESVLNSEVRYLSVRSCVCFEQFCLCFRRTTSTNTWPCSEPYCWISGTA